MNGEQSCSLFCKDSSKTAYCTMSLCNLHRWDPPYRFTKLPNNSSTENGLYVYTTAATLYKPVTRSTSSSHSVHHEEYNYTNGNKRFVMNFLQYERIAKFQGTSVLSPNSILCVKSGSRGNYRFVPWQIVGKE